MTDRMTDRELLEQALDALSERYVQEFANTLRKGLAQPDPLAKIKHDEPVAYIYEVRFTDRSDRADRQWHYYGLYRSCKQVEAMLERTTDDDDIEGRIVPLYTAQTRDVAAEELTIAFLLGIEQAKNAAKRKPLTQQQAIAMWSDKSDGPSNAEIFSYCRAVERAHGIGGGDDTGDR